MKSLMALAIIVLPTLSMAQGFKLPTPKKGERICYSRTYSQDHLERHARQRVKEVQVDLERSVELESDYIYASIKVKTKKNNNYSNGGVVLNGEAFAKTLGSSAQAVMDCDSGSFKVTQSQSNSKDIKVEIDFLLLASSTDCGGEMTIDKNTDDAVMILSQTVCPKN